MDAILLEFMVKYNHNFPFNIHFKSVLTLYSACCLWCLSSRNVYLHVCLLFFLVFAFGHQHIIAILDFPTCSVLISVIKMRWISSALSSFLWIHFMAEWVDLAKRFEGFSNCKHDDFNPSSHELSECITNHCLSNALQIVEIYCQTSYISAPNPKTQMFLVSSCSCLCQIHWSQVLSREWRCSWSSTDRGCANYIWGINNFIPTKVWLLLEVSQ